MQEFEAVDDGSEAVVVADDAAAVNEVNDDDVDDDDVQDGELGEEILLLEEVESELVLEVWEPTGEPRVDAALDRLAELDPDDVHQHAAVFDDIHQQLRATLTNLDSPS